MVPPRDQETYETMYLFVYRLGHNALSGAYLVAPFLRYKRAFVYLSHSIEKVALALGWKEVSSGPNVTILEPYDEGIFYGLQEINGMKVVSDTQLYLDLKGYKERGEEAAQFLLENRLRKQW